MSQILNDQDARATRQAGSIDSHSFENLIAKVADVHSLIYMASQRARRARVMLTEGPIDVRLTSLWIDAFLAGVAFEREKHSKKF